MEDARLVTAPISPAMEGHIRRRRIPTVRPIHIIPLPLMRPVNNIAMLGFKFHDEEGDDIMQSWFIKI
jgi:hypothetical protein